MLPTYLGCLIWVFSLAHPVRYHAQFVVDIGTTRGVEVTPPQILTGDLGDLVRLRQQGRNALSPLHHEAALGKDSAAVLRLPGPAQPPHHDGLPAADVDRDAPPAGRLACSVGRCHGLGSFACQEGEQLQGCFAILVNLGWQLFEGVNDRAARAEPSVFLSSTPKGK